MRTSRTVRKVSCELNPHILRYIKLVEAGPEYGGIEACEEQHLLVDYIRYCFETEDIYVNEVQLQKYLSMVQYFPFEFLFEWEEFLLALHDCTYWKSSGLPRWPDLFILGGRGFGKDGYIAYESFCLISPHNGIRYYDVDICATNEEQAMMPFLDVLNSLEAPAHNRKLKKFFYWNKEEIICVKTGSKMKYRTNSPKGKDGLRSGIVAFNEVHQYTDYKNINVFTTGLGKKKHPRRTYATTNGDVRDGPLDDYIERSEQILHGGGSIPDNGWLPFICKLDNREEVHDKSKWEKPNPSLRYKPELRQEMEKEYEDWKISPSQFSAFMTKRMNIPDGNPEIEVTSWENINATDKSLPDLEGHNCVAGIDFVKVTDFASAGLLFKVDGMRYWITHTWVCARSKDLPRIKYPIKKAAEQGLLTIVDDVEIPPELIVSWIDDQAAKYNILEIAIDNYRYALLSRALKGIGFDAKDDDCKKVKLVRPGDIIVAVPVIDHLFATQQIAWGDNSLMRWGTNNTKLAKVKGAAGQDKGNWTYGKIEAKSRKTDPFMAFVAAMTLDSKLEDGASVGAPDVGVYTY